jgi:hypothetical protein
VGVRSRLWTFRPILTDAPEKKPSDPPTGLKDGLRPRPSGADVMGRCIVPIYQFATTRTSPIQAGSP